MLIRALPSHVEPCLAVFTLGNLGRAGYLRSTDGEPGLPLAFHRLLGLLACLLREAVAWRSAFTTCLIRN